MGNWRQSYEENVKFFRVLLSFWCIIFAKNEINITLFLVLERVAKWSWQLCRIKFAGFKEL